MDMYVSMARTKPRPIVSAKKLFTFFHYALEEAAINVLCVFIFEHLTEKCEGLPSVNLAVELSYENGICYCIS